MLLKESEVDINERKLQVIFFNIQKVRYERARETLLVDEDPGSFERRGVWIDVNHTSTNIVGPGSRRQKEDLTSSRPNHEYHMNQV